MVTHITSDLALLGGNPIRKEPLPTYNTIGVEEKAAVMAVLDSGELSGFVASAGKEFYGGREVQGLEADFCEMFGVRHAVAVNSATSGLHCALAATGIGPGDEVIVPPYTMSASATAVLFTGAIPVFADVDPETFCLCPEAVEAAIGSRTKGIVAVNLFGQACKLQELRRLADTHGLYLIEDNAQAPGALHHGAYTATIGHAGVFSFNRHKTMQSGEGGVVVTQDSDLALRMALVRNHGEVVVGQLGIENITNTVGLNYRMTEMEAAVARVQLRRLDQLNEQRVELADRLTSRLLEFSGLTPPKLGEGNSHVFYFYGIRFDPCHFKIPRELFCRAVAAEGFVLRAGYVKPIYLEPVYQQKKCFGDKGFPFNQIPRDEQQKYSRGLCPVVEDLADSSLMVTNIIYPPLTVADMDCFADACAKVIEKQDELARFGANE